MYKLLAGIFVALISFNAHASGYWPDPWSEEFPDPCTGSYVSSPYCSLDPDPLHCSWYYAGGTNHPLCVGRPSFPRVCEIRGSCINPGEPIPPNPCDTEPAWCQGPNYRPNNVTPTPPPPPVEWSVPPANLTVVEYVSPQGTFFLSTNVEEQALLDSQGVWRRTTQTFKAWSQQHNVYPVYRFWNGAVHFYTHDSDMVAARRFNRDAVEEGIEFYVVDQTPFGCPAGMRPVYLVWNSFRMRFVADSLMLQAYINGIYDHRNTGMCVQ
jgi:hypothetical protein